MPYENVLKITLYVDYMGKAGSCLEAFPLLSFKLIGHFDQEEKGGTNVWIDLQSYCDKKDQDTQTSSDNWLGKGAGAIWNCKWQAWV